MSTVENELEDWALAALKAVAMKQGIGVPDLIRTAIEEKYLAGAHERVEAFRAWKAPWRDRDDLTDTDDYVRSLREDDRIARINSE